LNSLFSSDSRELSAGFLVNILFCSCDFAVFGALSSLAGSFCGVFSVFHVALFWSFALVFLVVWTLFAERFFLLVLFET